MTREEAHGILSNGLANAPSEHEWCMAFEMAIKALEQIDVLDKIRAEIDAKFDDRPSSYNHAQRREFYSDVVAIIDKYKKETEQCRTKTITNP